MFEAAAEVFRSAAGSFSVGGGVFRCFTYCSPKIPSQYIKNLDIKMTRRSVRILN